MSATNNHHVTTAPAPRAALDESFFLASPGPMTLVSNFFSGDYYCRSFCELLAGDDEKDDDGGGGSQEKVNDEVEGLKERRAMKLVINLPESGFSPSCFLNSPPAAFLSPQSPFGISHQQATVEAVLAQPNMQMQVPSEPLVNHPSSTLNDDDGSEQKVEALSNASHAEKKYQLPSSSSAIDKPAKDGYNWRKYGQKQVKGSEYPRSYYKCTHLNCPVKKKVERGRDGHITEIIYKGNHNHEKPQANKSVRVNNNDSNENASTLPTNSSEPNSQGWFGNSNKLGESESLFDCSTDQTFYQEVSRQVLGSSESEDMCDVVVKEAEGDENEPNPKRRNTDHGVYGVPLPKQTVTEAKIVVQTRSEVDILDDGYRWRKYGQKVVKGNPHPRSYYKCTSAGCNVRKHVERASMDPKAVITTYEGKHDHDVPAPRNSSHNTGTSNSMPLKGHKVVHEKHPLLKDMEFGNNIPRPVHLRLKEEQIIV